ncbi:MAG: glycosyltransferase family 4 protein [Chitinophagaceae bacterium]|nr:glycosyltransferase family 4 protein [Chitinophagaceae bacterium]
MNEDYPRHVVIIGPAHPLRGGLASYDERLAREFIHQGFKTTIYTFSYQYPGFLFPGTTQFSTEPVPEDINIRIRINSVNPLNWILVGNELKKIRPDIIVVRYWLPFMGPCFGTILRRVKKNHFTKIICIADNIIPHEKRPGDVMFTKYFVRPVDGFITMSKEVLDQLTTMNIRKPAKYVLHPLYDNFGEKISKEEARKTLQIDNQSRLLLFFGFIRKYKGLDLLLKAMKILVRNNANNDLKLLIAGEFYEDPKHYEELLNDSVLEKHLIVHTQFISDPQVKFYLCAADCIVQPYRDATQSGVTPLAYHFEIPMIVTNVGGLPSMVPDKKVGLVTQPDPQHIADAITEYFRIGKENFLMGLREEKKKYSWKEMVNVIVNLAKEETT